MSILFYAFLFAIAIVLQKTIAPLFSINDITPDFILILVIAFSLQQGRVRGILCAFVVGLLFDSIGTEFVGLSSLSQSVAAYLAGLFGGERLERRLGGIVGFLFFVIFIHDFIYNTILSLGTSVTFFRNVFKVVLPSTCYTLIFVIILHLIWPKALWGSKR